jgi:peptidoglycan hydrolase CwlO-like protein
MRKLSFWASGEGQQIRAINEAADELDRLQSHNSFMQPQVDSLRRQVDSQRSEIGQLKAALQAVCDLLVDLDLVEEEALGYRIDAAVAEAAAAEAARAAPLAAPPASPFGPPSSASSLVASEASCSRCRREVPARDITFTDRGPVCESCLPALAFEPGE